MELKKEMDKLKFDTRMIEWNLKNGHLKPKDLQSHISQLPDCSANSDVIKFEDLEPIKRSETLT